MRWLLWFALSNTSVASETDTLAPGVVGAMSADAGGRVQAWSERFAGSPWVVLRVAVAGRPVWTVDDRGNPDRAVVSPDGRFVAYVSAAKGLAGVWVLRVSDGARVGLTNQDLPPAKTGAPAGWVPPPRDDLRFDGATLRWASGSVTLPEGWR